MPSYLPVSQLPIQYSKSNGLLANDYWLKFYQVGLATPISIYPDSSGSSPMAKCKLGEVGFPLSNPAVETSYFIPHLDDTISQYGIVIYKSAADADANNLANALEITDGIISVWANINSISTSVVKSVANFAALGSVAISYPGQVVEIAGHTVNGRGGGSFSGFTSQVGLTQDGGNVIFSGTGAWKRISDYVTLENFGADPTNFLDCATAYYAALAGAGTDGVINLKPGAVYKFNNAITGLGGVGNCARLQCSGGWATFNFVSVPSSDDCFTANGAGMRQTVVDGVIIKCNATGRDGFVQSDCDGPEVRVQVLRSARDSFVVQPGPGGFIENGKFNVFVQDAGRHAVRQHLTGSGGAFINECTWESLEVRGVSKLIAGGQVMRITSSATDPASKFSDHIFLKSNADAQYQGTGPVPSLNVIECDSGIVENFTFLCAGWENTGAGSISGGYTVAVTGTGIWGGLTTIGVLNNSRWGDIGYHPNITKLYDLNYSFGVSSLNSLLRLPKNVSFKVHLAASQTNLTGDGTAVSLSAYAVVADHDNTGAVNTGNGIFTAPISGRYKFETCQTLTNIGAGHTNGLLGILVSTGASSGLYPSFETNLAANKNAMGGLTAFASLEVLLAAGDLVIPYISSSGSTKTIGLTGGVNTSGWFSGHLIG